jgi:sRNA-binding carbon storage regulator CsrA
LEGARADKLAKQVTSLDQELKRATKALEKSKSEGKRHLTIQLQLLEASKKELFTVNESLLAEQRKVAELKSQLVLEMAVKEAEQSKVAKLKSQLVLEMAAKEYNAKEFDRMKEVIASEQKKANILREELEQTTTAKESMAQELNDNKLRAERVKKLELELREERAKIARLGNNPPKATMTLRKELHETQEKLKNAKKRNAVLTSELAERSYPQRQQQQTGHISQRKKGSAVLPTTVADALDSDSKTPPKVLLSPKRATSMPAPVEVSLSERASLVNFESAPVHYDGVAIDNDDDDAEESSALQDELTFIRSAFSAEEILVDDNQVTYTLQLPVDDDSEVLKIDISVILPVRYPTAGINEMNVVVNDTSSTCSPEFRKIALDALPSVKEICLIEARALEGSAALSSIFSVADMWAKDDWYSVMAKQLSLSKGKGKGKPSKKSGGNGSFEICTFLIYTHHIVDPDKIHFVKKSASKLNLGGYMKIGKPGLLLVEGPQSDCEALLDTLLLNRKKLRESHGGKVDSATFMAAGNVVRKAMTSSERVLPKKLEQLEAKDGMDKIKDACKISGLLGSLEEVCKR